MHHNLLYLIALQPVPGRTRISEIYTASFSAFSSRAIRVAHPLDRARVTCILASPRILHNDGRDTPHLLRSIFLTQSLGIKI